MTSSFSYWWYVWASPSHAFSDFVITLCIVFVIFWLNPLIDDVIYEQPLPWRNFGCVNEMSEIDRQKINTRFKWKVEVWKRARYSIYRIPLYLHDYCMRRDIPLISLFWDTLPGLLPLFRHLLPPFAQTLWSCLQKYASILFMPCIMEFHNFYWCFIIHYYQITIPLGNRRPHLWLPLGVEVSQRSKLALGLHTGLVMCTSSFNSKQLVRNSRYWLL